MPEPGRQGEDMPNRLPASHAQHDLVLIAAHAAGDVSTAERSAAEAQLVACDDCRELADDLRAIAAATATLPAPARIRDFTLRSQDAARLRPRGWRRVVAALGPARLELARPLAPVLMTLGVVGLLISGLPLVQGSGTSFSSAGAASQAVAPREAASAAASAAAAPAAAGASVAPAPSRSLVNLGSADASAKAAFGPVTSASPVTDTAGEGAYALPTATAAPEARISAPPASVTRPGPDIPLAALSALALLAGVALFGLRRAFRTGPEN